MNLPQPRTGDDTTAYVRTSDGAVFIAQNGTQQAADLAADPDLTETAK